MQILICVPETPYLEKNLNIAALVPTNCSKRERLYKAKNRPKGRGYEATKHLGIKALHSTKRKRVSKSTVGSPHPSHQNAYS